MSGLLGAGAPDRIRTYDLLLRRQTLYPLSYRGAIVYFTGLVPVHGIDRL